MLAGIACSSQGFLNDSGVHEGQPPQTLIASPLIHGLAFDGSVPDGDLRPAGTEVPGASALVIEEPPPALSPDLLAEWAEVHADSVAADPTVVAQSVPKTRQAPVETTQAREQTGQALTEAQMDALLESVGWPVATREAAKAIAYCESHWQPGATGAAGERGLWQTLPQFHQAKADALFGPGADLYDPVVNAAVAMVISAGGQSWAAWSCRTVLQ